MVDSTFSQEILAWLSPLSALLRKCSLKHAYGLSDCQGRYDIFLKTSFLGAFGWRYLFIQPVLGEMPSASEASALCLLICVGKVSKSVHIQLWLLLNEYSLALISSFLDHHHLRRALLGYLFLLFFSVKVLIALPFHMFLLVSWSYACLLNCSLPRYLLLWTVSLSMGFSMVCSI